MNITIRVQCPVPETRDDSGDRWVQATTESTCHDESTLAMKLMGRVIQSPEQKVPVAPQNGPRSNKNFKKKL